MDRRCLWTGLAVLGSVLAVTSGGGFAGDATTRQYLPGADVRCLAQGAEGRVWIGTADGAYVFEGGDEAPARVELPELTGRRVNDVVVDPGGVVWFCTDKGLVRVVGDEVTSINQMEIPFGGQDRPYPLREMAGLSATGALSELGEVLCGVASGDSLWFGLHDAIVRYIPQENAWSAQTHYWRWGFILGCIGSFGPPRPIRDCRQLAADGSGLVWALAQDAPLAWNPRSKSPIWETGYVLNGDGDDSAVVPFYKFYQVIPQADTSGSVNQAAGAAPPTYAVPAAIATAPSGAIRLLTQDGRVFKEPIVPDVAGGAVRGIWEEFAQVGLPDSARTVLRTATTLACSADRLVAGGVDADGRPTICVSAEVEETTPVVHSLSDQPAEVRDVLIDEGRGLLVATSLGLVQLPTP